MRVLIIAWAILLCIPMNAFAKESGSASQYSYEQLIPWVTLFDSWYDQIPESDYPQITSIEDVNNWMNDLVPLFGYEGITSVNLSNGHENYVYPLSITAEYYDSSQDHIHVLGRTNCFTTEITLNARYFNPASSLYNSPDLLATLTHELAHAQGICYADTPLNEEVSAQLVMLEVLSADANKGNVQAFATVVYELRGMMIAALKSRAIVEGRLDQFWTFMDGIETDPFQLARMQKSERYWQADPAKLAQILNDYNYIPMTALLDGVIKGYCWYYEHDYELDPAQLTLVNTKLDQPCIAGVLLPVNWRVFEYPLIIDDLAYIIAHGDELVASLQ